MKKLLSGLALVLAFTCGTTAFATTTNSIEKVFPPLIKFYWYDIEVSKIVKNHKNTYVKVILHEESGYGTKTTIENRIAVLKQLYPSTPGNNILVWNKEVYDDDYYDSLVYPEVH